MFWGVSMGKSRILVVGATGYIGKHIVKASARLGHPTFVLVRPSKSAPDAAKKELLDSFESLGVFTLHGDLISDHTGLVEALKQVDVVISAVGMDQLLDGQLNLIQAIQEVGHIKRFLPSEFANDCERHLPYLPVLEPSYGPKTAIRKAVREVGIPYTLVCNSAFAGFHLDTLAQLDTILAGTGRPPRDKVTILGSGEEKTVLVAEEDVGILTIKAVDDPRTLNKQLVIRPKANTLSFNKIVELWEKKLGHSLDKMHVPEVEVMKEINELSPPANFIQAINWELTSGHSIFELGPHDVDANQLYPDVKYVSVDKYLDKLAQDQI